MQHEWKLAVDVEVAVDCEYECECEVEVDSVQSASLAPVHSGSLSPYPSSLLVPLLSLHDDIIKLALCSVVESLFCSALYLPLFLSLSLFVSPLCAGNRKTFL